eukprot:TRINITY_DN874_c0_g1_i2.p1 TRINITY_DN874_c0_g1~~TRINITY_DN874_c0_g1_i2.p1  ORF type:complete len:571 (-),score=132.14 TRINITY_DN874_c0_g1_i2:221-1933(-)
MDVANSLIKSFKTNEKSHANMVGNLKEELSIIQDRNSSISDELEETLNKIESYEVSIKKLNKKISKMEDSSQDGQVEELTEKNKDLENQLQKANVELSLAINDVNKLKKKLSRAQVKYTNLSNSIEESKDTVSDLENKIEELESKLVAEKKLSGKYYNKLQNTIEKYQQESEISANLKQNFKSVNDSMNELFDSGEVNIPSISVSSEDELEKSSSGEDSQEEFYLQRIEKRIQITNEILETEQSYLSGLLKIVEKYIEPLKKSGIISDSQINDIFGKVQLILDINTEFYNKLEDRIENWQDDSTVGDLLLEFAIPLKSYTEYLNNYETSVSTLVHLKQENEDFRNFIHFVEKNDRDHKDINSYLITPIQRIPHYLLYANDLKKYTYYDHPDYNLVVKALEEINKTGVYVNEKKRDAERAQALLEAQYKLSGIESLLAKNREFIHEGEVLELNRKGKDPLERYLFLFSDMILVAKRKKDKKAKRKSQIMTNERYKKVYSIKFTPDTVVNDNVHFDEDLSSSYSDISENDCFSIRTSDKEKKTVIFKGDSTFQKNRWIKALSLALEYYQDDI